MTRVIKSTRAVELQGKRAGFFSRAIASGIDLGVAFALLLAIIFVVQAVLDLISSDTITIETPNPGLSGSGMILVFTIYLAIGWGSTGRTVGKQIMGLRVVRTDTEPLRPMQALGRGLLCAVFYPCLLLALFHRRNAGVEDLVCGSVVVYDWIPASARRRMPTPVTGTVSREAGA